MQHWRWCASLGMIVCGCASAGASSRPTAQAYPADREHHAESVTDTAEPAPEYAAEPEHTHAAEPPAAMEREDAVEDAPPAPPAAERTPYQEYHNYDYAPTSRPAGGASGELPNDWGLLSTTGKYRGRRTNYWRELALSGDPSALPRLLRALQYYPSPAAEVGVAGRGEDGELVTGERVSPAKPNSILTRRDAAEALGILGDPRATRALEDALNDPDFLVRQNAARSLLQIRERTR